MLEAPDKIHEWVLSSADLRLLINGPPIVHRTISSDVNPNYKLMRKSSNISIETKWKGKEIIVSHEKLIWSIDAVWPTLNLI